MGIEDLKQNIARERMLVRNIYSLSSKMKFLNDNERIIVQKNISSLLNQLKLLNRSVPEILNSISPYKPLEQQKEVSKELVKIEYPEENKIVQAVVQKEDRTQFLEELNLSNQTIKRLKKRKIIKKENYNEFRGAGTYSKLSNKFFQNLSYYYINKGYFKKLNVYLRKANMLYLLVTYISMAFLTSFLGFFISIPVALLIFYFFNYLWALLLIPATPVLIFLGFYFYPASEASSIENKIDLEIPFVTIHMSAIAGSGIEPTQIFKIIGMGDEYPATRVEFKKILNKINIYGYDLVSALKNTGRETSSRKFAELLNGMTTSISGGTQLSDFLDKRAESLLFEYKLEKERYTKTTETLMDIYISLMIAAPMVMTLLLVLMSISSLSIGLSMGQLTVLIISVVSLINVLFLVFLRLNQSNY